MQMRSNFTVCMLSFLVTASLVGLAFVFFHGAMKPAVVSYEPGSNTQDTVSTHQTGLTQQQSINSALKPAPVPEKDVTPEECAQAMHDKSVHHTLQAIRTAAKNHNSAVVNSLVHSLSLNKDARPVVQDALASGCYDDVREYLLQVVDEKPGHTN